MDFWHPERLGALLQHLRDEPMASKAISTLVLVLLLYGVHRLTSYYIGRLVTRPETRVKYWGWSRALWVTLGTALVGAVWLEELKTVTLVLAGVVAGVLISGKEVFLGLAGRMSLAVADHYKIGDRIRINGLCGDVINIGLLYTWLLEVDYGHAENQATGRVVLMPHLWLTQHSVTNATLGHEYVWDEIELGFPLSVDGQRVTRLLMDAAGHFLRAEVEEAARNVPRLGRTFAAKDPPVTPIAYARLEMQSSGHQYLVVTVRYAIPVRQRRGTHSALTLHLLALLRAERIPVYQNFPWQTGPEPAPDGDATSEDGEAGIGDPPAAPGPR